MRTTRLFSMREAQPPFKPALKYLQEQMVLRLWTPSIGQRTNLSTRDGNCGQKRLDSPLMPWWEIKRKPRFLTSIISQSAYDALENKEDKYSSERIDSYFTLFELLLAPKSYSDRTSHHLEKIQITFKTIQTPART